MKKFKSRELLRNLKKSFGDSFLNYDLENLKKSNPSDEMAYKILTHFEDFLVLLEKSYNHLQNELDMAKTNVKISSSDMIEARNSLLATKENLGQDFFMINKELKFLPHYTTVCKDLIGEDIPASKEFLSFLKIESSQKKELKIWIEAMFKKGIDVNHLLPFCPLKIYPHKNKYIKVKVKTSKNLFGEIDKLIFCLTDKTKERRVQKKIKHKTQEALLIAHIANNKREIHKLVFYIKNFYEENKSYENEKVTSEQLENFKRFFHSLRGISRQLKINSCHNIVEDIEKKIYRDVLSYSEFLNHIKNYKKALDEFLFKYIHILGKDFNRMSEHATVQKKYLGIYFSKKSLDEACKFVKQVLAEPISKAFVKFNEPLSEMSHKLNKLLLPLKICGGETKIFLDPYDHLFVCFIHLFRNIIDHGIEAPSQRKFKGKKRAGRISIFVSEFQKDQKDWYEIKIEDDGRGIDIEKIKKKKPFLKNKEDFEVAQEIFQPNFSTKDVCTDLSGRGTGLDVISKEVESLGGVIWVESKKDLYCRFFIHLPQIWDLNFNNLKKKLSKAS